MMGERKPGCSSAAFKAWRKRMRMSRLKASRAIGISPSNVYIYETGKRYGTDKKVDVPLTVALACQAVEHNLTPIV